MWLPFDAIKKVHKTNYEITSTRNGDLPEHILIQKWNIN